METLKLRENLFRRGNDIISYDTVVAHIEDDKLIEHGRYSRTTSKHIGHVARIFNLSVVHAKNKERGFYKYETGEIKINIPGALSVKTSTSIATLMGTGSTFLQAVAVIEKMPQKDLVIIDRYLKDLGITDEQFSIFKRVNQLSKMI
jgi:hypothetical protein